MSIYNVGGGGAKSADKIKYDNTESGLQATNVQDAVDELNNNLTENLTALTEYSTNETRIGTWYNGKPLYRKTIDMGTSMSYVLQIANIEDLIIDLSASFMCLNNPNIIYYYYPFIVTSPSDASLADIYYEKKSNKIIVRKNFNDNVVKNVVTIKYTKTTD